MYMLTIVCVYTYKHIDTHSIMLVQELYALYERKSKVSIHVSTCMQVYIS